MEKEATNEIRNCFSDESGLGDSDAGKNMEIRWPVFIAD